MPACKSFRWFSASALAALAASAQPTWVPRYPLPTANEFVRVGWSGKAFVAAGYGRVIVSSPDGVEWTKRWSDTAGVWGALAWTGTQWIVSGNAPGLMTSPDGATWTPHPEIDAPHFGDLAAHDSVLVGSSGTSAYRSTDGVHWDKVLTDTYGITGIAWGNGGWICFSVSHAWTSVDGRQWVSHDLPEVDPPFDAVWTGTEWAAVGPCSVGFRSADGFTWEKWMPWYSCTDYYAVQWTGSRIVARGSWLETSVDQKNWIHAELDSFPHDKIMDMAFDGKTLVAVGQQGALETSTDGLHWTSRRYGSANSIYVAAAGPAGIAAIGPGKTYFSADGIAWSEYPYLPDYVRTLIWAGDRYVAAGDHGYVYASKDGKAWSVLSRIDTVSRVQALAWTGASLVASLNPQGILTSPDGVAWTPASVDTGDMYMDMAWHGKELWAIGHHGTLASSTDGTNWQKRRTVTKDDINSLESVASSGKALIAMYGSRYSITTDGSTWTERYFPFRGGLNRVRWTGDRFTVIGDEGLLATSPDGLTWTQSKTETREWMMDAAALPDRIVAVGVRGTVFTTELAGTGIPGRGRETRFFPRRVPGGIEASLPAGWDANRTRAFAYALNGRLLARARSSDGGFRFSLADAPGLSGPCLIRIESEGKALSRLLPFSL
jgi:hypothetical protein